MTAPTMTSFGLDPIASDSARFPLGAPFGRVSDDTPSRPEVRPWVLRGMQAQTPAGGGTRMVRFDHRAQVVVDGQGRPVIEAGPPTVTNKTNNDGDEGPSEDFSYDFVPDEPFQV